MKEDFKDVQHIVLSGSDARMARHLVVRAGASPNLRHFLAGLLKDECGPTGDSDAHRELQLSLGFSRRGLENLDLPSHVMAVFSGKAPAFTAGAAQRAAGHVGSTGESAPNYWDPHFGFLELDAVLSLHAWTRPQLAAALCKIRALAASAKVRIIKLLKTEWLPSSDDEYLVHFGYRDRLSRVGVKGWTSVGELIECRPFSRHAAGEFVLGHVQNTGANPWLSDGRGETLPEKLRGFFRNGSFGVLHQMEQKVAEFEDFITRAARDHALKPDEVRAKLCGRREDGSPLVQPPGSDPAADFGYQGDPEGLACPFGSHMRRMAPRDDARAQTRQRPVLRRGMPYGPSGIEGDDARGLTGLFFCASIEDQFEHLLGQWAERVPLGSPDPGGARDPLIGGHEPGDGVFVIPRAGSPSVELDGLRRFTRTRGTAYLFYPSLTTLEKIAREEPFADVREPGE